MSQHQDLDGRYVVASALRDPEFLAEVAENLTPGHFPTAPLQALWVVILTLAGRGSGVTTQSLVSYLDSLNQDEAVKRTNVNFVLELTMSVPPLDRAMMHQSVENLRTALRTTMMTATVHEAAAALATGDSARAERILTEIGERLTGPEGAHRTVVQASEEAAAAEAEYLRLQDQGPPPSTPFGFLSLDEVTDGIAPGRLIILAAATGECKSTLAYHLTETAVTHRRRPLYFSLEVSAPEVLCSVRAVHGARRNMRFSPRDVVRGCLSAEQWSNYQRVLHEFDRDGYLTVASGEFSIVDLERRLCYAAAAGRPYDVVFVDYNQLLKPRPQTDRRYRDSREELGSVLRELKQISMRRNVGMVGLHQINRDGRNQAEVTGRYGMSDLAESSEVERNADIVVWSLRREAERQRGELLIGVMKNRRGPLMEPKVFMADLAHCHIAEVRAGLSASFERYIA